MRVFDPIHKQLHVDRVCKFKSLTRCHSECMFVKGAGAVAVYAAADPDGLMVLSSSMHVDVTSL